MNRTTDVPLRRRKYNQWVANETLEDYALRFTAKQSRRWSPGWVANTALGIVSFLALEAIGGVITLDYGFTNALWAILAVGDGRVIRSGAGNGVVSGGIIVADIAGPDGIFGTDDDCASGSGFGSAAYEVDGGGTGNTTYSATDLNAANPPEPYNIVAFKQE